MGVLAVRHVIPLLTTLYISQM